MKQIEHRLGLSGALLALVLAACSNDDPSTGITCGTGTVLIDRQCRVTGVDPEAGDASPGDAAALDAEGDGGPGENMASDGSARNFDAGSGNPDRIVDLPEAAAPPPTCPDGQMLDRDPCPATPVVDCSNSCDNRLPCPVQPSGCAWSGQDADSIQLDGSSVATVRTPEGVLPTTGCATKCGDTAAERSAYGFAITTSHRWSKITVAAPWRVVALDDDLCHPADNHCLLVRNGAMILAPTACMPAKNVVIEPITDTASCP